MPSNLNTRLRLHLSRALSGMGSLFGAFDARDYPSWQGFEHDARQLESDWRQVGGDMRAALKREKQTRPLAHGK